MQSIQYLLALSVVATFMQILTNMSHPAEQLKNQNM